MWSSHAEGRCNGETVLRIDPMDLRIYEGGRKDCANDGTCTDGLCVGLSRILHLLLPALARIVRDLSH